MPATGKMSFELTRASLFVLFFTVRPTVTRGKCTSVCTAGLRAFAALAIRSLHDRPAEGFRRTYTNPPPSHRISASQGARQRDGSFGLSATGASRLDPLAFQQALDHLGTLQGFHAGGLE